MKNLLIVLLFFMVISCVNQVEEKYSVTDKYTITIKTFNGSIKLVPILEIYNTNKAQIIVVDEDSFFNVEPGDTIYIQDRIMVRTANKSNRKFKK
jgi:hypothetical protein